MTPVTLYHSVACAIQTDCFVRLKSSEKFEKGSPMSLMRDEAFITSWLGH